MKSIPVLLCFLCCLLLSFRASAQSQITATVTFTNYTSNGWTISVNGVVRTYQPTVVSAATQIATNGTAGGSMTNTLEAFFLAPQTGMNVAQVPGSTNQINFMGWRGAPMTVVFTTPGAIGFASVAYTTYTPTNLIAVRVPTNNIAITAIGNSERVTVESGLVAYLNDQAMTNQLNATNAPFAQFLGVTNAWPAAANGVTNVFANGNFTQTSQTSSATYSPTNGWKFTSSAGTSSLTSNQNLTIAGAANIGGALAVTGSSSLAAVTASGTVAAPSFTGSFTGNGAGISNAPINTNSFVWTQFTNGVSPIGLTANAYFTNTFGRKITVYLTLTNNSSAAQLGFYLFQSNGIPAFISPTPTLAMYAPASALQTNSLASFSMDPWSYGAYTNLAAGLLNCQNYFLQAW